MTAAARRAVIVMAKRPAAGHTKTRLTPELSPQQAADMYERLLRDTLANLNDRDDCTTLVAVDAPASKDYFSAIAPDIDQVEQVGDALGDRLDAVLSAALDLGFSSVFAVGSDSPDLPPDHLGDAFGALERDDVDVVLGPTEDGGYYLIGWKERWRSMVTDVTMSTATVLQDTLKIAADLEARVHLVPEWYDVDSPADLDRLRNSPAAAQRAPKSLQYLAQVTD